MEENTAPMQDDAAMPASDDATPAAPAVAGDEAMPEAPVEEVVPSEEATPEVPAAE